MTFPADHIFHLDGTEITLEAALGDLASVSLILADKIAAFPDDSETDDWNAALADIETVQALLRSFIAPYRDPFPVSGECPCGSSSWLNRESGYERWSVAEWRDGELVVFHNGWSDMSEGGAGEWVACAVCDAEFELPDKVSHT